MVKSVNYMENLVEDFIDVEEAAACRNFMTVR